jgi:phosphoadenosine phosphosulfate reductase
MPYCKSCSEETELSVCPQCGKETIDEIPTEIEWCPKCNIPLIEFVNSKNKQTCRKCSSKTHYLSTDIRPVFPEERLLFEIMTAKPLEYLDKSVWANNNRYFVNGKAHPITSKFYKDGWTSEIIDKLKEFKSKNSYKYFENYIQAFCDVNKERLNGITHEAFEFISNTVKEGANNKPYPLERVVISFSGGKDSTVTQDLTIRALGEPSLVHVFGDTTLEFPLTYQYVNRFKENNPLSIFKTARNNDQEFLKVAKDIGPPARMMRWCCSMFKTGPITRVINSMFPDQDILTFYGIRKCESVSRSKYNRIEDNADEIKIQKQKVASPIFFWKDIDIWLYIFTENIDFNDAYKFGYDRVGCWMCPNNNLRAQFLSKIYMPEESKKWRDFLIEFAQSIDKPDAEEYVDSGAWKARQGGNGLRAAKDVKIRYSNCTTEADAKVYSLIRPIDKHFYELFIPFGKVSFDLGRKLLDEVIVVDLKTKMPILSIQPFDNEEFEQSVKIKIMNVKDRKKIERMVEFQIRKHNACRKCLKCESLCKYGAITMQANEYHIDEKKCVRCQMCMESKYLSGGCLMMKYLRTRTDGFVKTKTIE